MKKTLAIGLVALLGACGQKEDHSIQYAAPRAPALNEQTAVASAETTLSTSATPPASSDPTFGMPGLADQLAAQLSDAAITYGMPAGATAKLSGPAARQAFDMTGMANCVTVDQPLDQSSLSVAWNACHFENTDAFGTTIVDIAGTLTWSAATGVTEWHLTDSTFVSMVDDTGQTFTMNATAKLDGKVAVSPTTIIGGSQSSVLMTEGPLTMGLTTTLAMDLDYTTDPAFCVTGGTLDVTQVWGPRPAGMSYQMAPDQGWRFAWTGCNQFTVSPGLSK